MTISSKSLNRNVGQSNTKTFALLDLGFRPFFFGAGVFAILSVVLWAAVYFYRVRFEFLGIESTNWHAHEMIYGFSLAVVAGFLLTAVGNWTGQPMPHGFRLFVLFALWVCARISFLFPSKSILIAAFFDLSFVFLLFMAIAIPIVRAKQWKQMGILSKIALLALGNLLFYLGALGILSQGVKWGIYGGLYLLIGLILTMNRRLIPFFVERGVGYNLKLKNSRLLDISSLLLFLAFFIVEVFLSMRALASWLALALFIVHALRLILWHTAGIWSKPLLWSMYISYMFIVLGFLLFWLTLYTDLPVFIAVHAFAFGGIGTITLSMMSRVSLGHTGRDVHNPSPLLALTFLLLISGALCRVVLPIFDMAHYKTWILIAQILWVAAFLLFLYIYTPMLMRPRIDGKPG